MGTDNNNQRDTKQCLLISAGIFNIKIFAVLKRVWYLYFSGKRAPYFKTYRRYSIPESLGRFFFLCCLLGVVPGDLFCCCVKRSLRFSFFFLLWYAPVLICVRFFLKTTPTSSVKRKDLWNYKETVHFPFGKKIELKKYTTTKNTYKCRKRPLYLTISVEISVWHTRF